jgi:hypothetical protein
VLTTLLLTGMLAAGAGEAAVLQVASAQAVAAEVVAETRVHGNVITPTDEVLSIAGVSIGTGVTASTMDEIAARLRASGRFESVEVLKRYASLTDPTRILVVIIVDEGPIRIVRGATEADPSRAVAARGPQFLWLPALSAEDGYGLSYGVRAALADPIGSSSRLSFPLLWGGRKRAGAELEKTFVAGPLTRVVGGAGLTSERNPFYRERDTRRGVFVRAERQFTDQLRAGLDAGWDQISFGGSEDRQARVGADLVFDTRLDPFLARNAVYGRAAWQHLAFRESPAADTLQLEARGYLGLVRQSVLVTRVVREDSNGPLPSFAQSLLGGSRNLRGVRAGYVAADTLVAGSAELFLPLTSPLGLARAGVSAFVDIATAYPDGARLADQRFERGVGGGVFLSAAFFHTTLSVAHGTTGSTRVHFNIGASF